jgi:hypothetical protein
MCARCLAAAVLAATAAAACRDASVDTEAARDARAAMLATIAAQLRQPPASLGVLEFEPVAFADPCLEIRRREPCPRQATEGFRLRLLWRGEPYEYRAPAASPGDAALASAPDPRVGTPGLQWSWDSAPGGCQTLLVSADARAAIGWCDGPRLALPWLEGSFAEAEWTSLYRRFQPFQRDSTNHALVFAGTGGDVATPAWRHAIDAWAALRWSELRAGRSAADGRALVYRRPVRDRATDCDVLEVTAYGVAYLARSTCEGGAGERGRAVWLSDPLWERMDSWLSTWAPYADESAGITFFGTGAHEPDASELADLTLWMDQAMAHVAYTATEAWPAAAGG